MTTTRELLKSISDDAFFESVAASTLRVANPLYRGLVETGTNADGRTITDPVDGIVFAKCEGSTAFAILAHHTTTSRPKLRAKWLHPTEGDLIKAYQVFEACRDVVDGMVRRLVICCSEDPSSGLVVDLQKRANQLGIDLDLWSGSSLAHVLDVAPDGQWVRFNKLDVPQQRLSSELASRVSRQMIEAFRPPPDPAEYVQRKIQIQIEERIGASSDLILVAGRSGVGKTVACYNVARDHTDRGGLVVAISEKLVSDSETLEEAIRCAVAAHAPGLSEPSLTRALLDLVPGTDVLVWIEDINRATSPVDQLRKVLSWTRAANKGQTKGASLKSGYGVTLLCPIWPEHVGLLSDVEKSYADTRLIVVEAYSPTEGAAAVARRSELMGGNLTSLQAEEISKGLSYDPLLIGLVTDWSEVRSDDIIEQYLQNEYNRLAITCDFLPAEFSRVLYNIAREMVVRRIVAPEGTTVLGWLSSEDRLVVRHIFRRSAALKIDSDGHLQFRHDRVRDYLFCAALSECFSAGDVSRELIEDPYFARIVGAAALRAPNFNAAVELLAVVSPLALFHAFATAVRNGLGARGALANSCEKVLLDPRFAARPLAETFAIKLVLGDLDGADVKHLLEISPGPCFARQEGLARNGLVRYAAAVCAHADPFTDYPRRDRIVAHILAKYGDTVISDLSAFLNERSERPELREGALYLAGEFGHDGLIEGLKTRWKEMRASEGAVTGAMLFAAVTCAAGRDEPFTTEIMAAWAGYPEDHDNEANVKSASDVARYALRGGLRRHASDRVVSLLMAAADNHPNLKSAVASTLSNVDHPAAVLNTAAAVSAIDILCKEKGSGYFNPWGHNFTNCWGGGFSERGARRMSESSRAALKAVWLDETNEAFYRYRSFELWAARLTASDLAELAQLQPQGLEDQVLRARLRHRDKTVKPLLAQRIRIAKSKAYWLQFVREVGSEGLEDLLRELLETRRQMKIERAGPYTEFDDPLSELIGDRDDALSLELISGHWDHLKTAPYFIHTLLYLATPMSLGMAAEAISEIEDRKKFFEFIHLHIGIQINGRIGLKRTQQVEALLPYWEDLSDSTRGALWEECNRRGWFEWRRRNLDSLMGPRLSHHGTFLDEEEDFASIDRALEKKRRHEFEAHYWSKHHLETGLTVSEVIGRAQRYAGGRMSADAYKFFADVVSEHGNRLDILKLDEAWACNIPNKAAEAANASFAIRLRSAA